MRFVAAILVILALGIFVADLASAEVTVNLQVAADGLTAPLNLVSPPDGTKRRFIIEQIGVIKILMPDGKILDEPFLNIRHRIVEAACRTSTSVASSASRSIRTSRTTGGSSSPTAATCRATPRSTRSSGTTTRTTSPSTGCPRPIPTRPMPLSERILSKIDWPQFNHNGHWIGFGPDGFLYISTGDGGYANDWGIGHNVTKGNGQDLDLAPGQDPPDRREQDGRDKGESYGIPADNPFVGRQDAKPEIWAYGFRNPWRCSFDMGGTKELFCADVGQNSFEEVDIVTKGGNYGWRVKEGSTASTT